MIKSSLKMKNTLADLDPAKIEKKIKALEAAEEKATKATKKLLEAQGIRAAKAEVKQMIDEALVKANEDADSAGKMREEAEQVLQEAKARRANVEQASKLLDARENELSRMADRLKEEEVRLQGLRKLVERDMGKAKDARKTYEAKVADLKKKLASL